jgi:hypothetical protein
MAKLPPNFSLQALPIESALSEGRDADARRLLVEVLKAGKADRVVQRIAADLISPPKRKRGRRSTLPKHWLDIAEDFEARRGAGTRYEDALRETSEKFGYGETHVRSCVAMFDEAREASLGE